MGLATVVATPGSRTRLHVGGIALLALFATILCALGAAYLLLAATTTLLPGDVSYLGMTKDDICREAGCEIVGFITHNRAAYGGAILASGVTSGWLVAGPLRAEEAWAWWALLLAGAVECACSISFIAYGHVQSYGFEAAHVLAIVGLTIAWAGGLLLTNRAVRKRIGPLAAFRTAGSEASARSHEGAGRLLFVFLALGFALSGASVLLVALTTVFVPQDVSFLGHGVDGVGDVNDRLLPLLAHDRAEFGAAMMTVGVLMAAAAWKGIGAYRSSLWLVLGAAGSIHFAAVIVSHFAVGYTNFMHLAPVYGASALLAVALCTWRPRKEQPGQLLTVHVNQSRSTAIESPQSSI